MHTHSHAIDEAQVNKAFMIGVALNLGYALTEAAIGWLADSVALMADAGHNLSDVLGLLVAWGGNALARRKPTHRRTYGYSRATSMASLISGMLLVLAMGGVGWEALSRFSPGENAIAHHPSGLTIMLVAGIGVLVNVATALLFTRGKDRDLNLKAAYLHMIADAGVSAGVVISGLLIWMTGLNWLDPATSLLLVVVILVATWGLLKDAVDLVFDAVPPNIEPRKVLNYFQNLKGVEACHDLHIWALSTTETALTIHLVMPEENPDDTFLFEINRDLREQFDIGHATVQVEAGNVPGLCDQSGEHRAR